MTETKDILNNLDRRFRIFSQQQFSFVAALDRCRATAFEPNRKISTICQVSHYVNHISDNRTDRRILDIFLSLVRDLSEFRRTLMKLTKQNDERLNKIFAKWKKILDPRQDISQLRVQFPYSHVNHLSCDEARNHFGGIISVIPVAMHCAHEAVERIDTIRAYRPAVKCEDNRPYKRAYSARPKSVNTRSQTIPSQYCKKAQPPSPVISSPISTPTTSQVSLRSAASSMRIQERPQRPCRVTRPASAGAAYCRKEAASGDRVMYPSPKAKPGVASQTPKYLGSTLMKPVLAWTNQTLSELEMERLIRQRKQNLVRPQWKP